MRNFDCFVGIDWTGAKSPVKTKSIAVAQCERGRISPQLIRKSWSRQSVGDYIETIIENGKRTLIGIDCNFGYAQSIIEKQIGHGKKAFDLWQCVEKYCANDTNFFAGSFWDHPEYTSYFWQQGKKPEYFLMPKRFTEMLCGESGYGWPESPFKLIGAKQVGKGGLAGMRLAHYLKEKHPTDVAIWPFDDNEKCNKAMVVITEIYPRQFIRRAGYGSQKIRNHDDLNSILLALKAEKFKAHYHSDHDTDAIIAAAGLRFLCGDLESIPKPLSNPHANRVLLQAEGWIFGVGYQ